VVCGEAARAPTGLLPGSRGSRHERNAADLEVIVWAVPGEGHQARWRSRHGPVAADAGDQRGVGDEVVDGTEHGRPQPAPETSRWRSEDHADSLLSLPARVPALILTGRWGRNGRAGGRRGTVLLGHWRGLHRQMIAVRERELELARGLYMQTYQQVRDQLTLEVLERQAGLLKAAEERNGGPNASWCGPSTR
jgi:hypothetical protein